MKLKKVVTDLRSQRKPRFEKKMNTERTFARDPSLSPCTEMEKLCLSNAGVYIQRLNNRNSMKSR